MTAALALYRAAARAAEPAVRAHLRRRAARGLEDPARLGERFGEASAPRPPGPLVWIHAASVGEAASVLPLIARLVEDPNLRVLATTGTVTSARLLAGRLPERAFHRYAPVDLPGAAARFLDHWRPDPCVFVESELWPNLIAAARARGLRMALAQARMSDRSWRRWRRFPSAARALLGGFAATVAQTPRDAERFRALGAPAVTVGGTLKYAAAPLPADPREVAAWKRVLAGRPAWVAASTHPGAEEAAVFAAHEAARAQAPGLLTVVAPRHPRRGPELAAAAAARGLRAARRGAGKDPPGAGVDVYVADTMGELGLFYRAAPLAFVGGSIARRGGHNPIEPIRLGCAALVGPDMRNFAGVADDLRAAAALRTTPGGAALGAAVAELLRGEPPGGEPMCGKTGRAALAARQKRAIDGKAAGALDAALAALAPLLPAGAGA